MSNPIIAVDTGNKLMKTQHCVFSAGVTEHVGNAPVSIEDVEVLGMGKSCFTISDQHIPNVPNKTKEPRYTTLLLFAIAKELAMMDLDKEKDSDGVIRQSIVLALGLPISHYGLYRNEYMRFYRNGGVPYCFTFKPIGGKPTKYEITVSRVWVFPQGFAATQSSAEFQKLTREGDSYIIDCGGYTSDICHMENGRPTVDYNRTFNALGMNSLYSTINHKIEEATAGSTFRDAQIEAILENGEKYGGVKKELVGIVLNVASQYAKDLVSRILEDGTIGTATSTIIFVGGGALRLKPYITEAVKMRKGTPHFIGEIKANAIGYYKLASAFENRASKK